MIFDALFSFGAAVVSWLLSGASLISLPVDLIGVLATIAGYGSYILGADLLFACMSCLAFFIGIRLTIAVATFVLSFIPTMSPK